MARQGWARVSQANSRGVVLSLNGVETATLFPLKSHTCFRDTLNKSRMLRGHVACADKEWLAGNVGHLAKRRDAGRARDMASLWAPHMGPNAALRSLAMSPTLPAQRA